MAQPNWNVKLKDVLKHDTEEIVLVSPKTGNEYKTDIIPLLKVVSTGSLEITSDGKYRYPVVDTNHNLEYMIKCQNKIDVKFGAILVFKNVRGGSTNRGGWYAADSVELATRNA